MTTATVIAPITVSVEKLLASQVLFIGRDYSILFAPYCALTFVRKLSWKVIL
jgi:hypothetical protein